MSGLYRPQGMRKVTLTNTQNERRGSISSSSSSSLALNELPKIESYNSTSTAPFILIIDDSSAIRKIVEITLRREGFQTQACCDGIEAMKWLASPEGRVPDLMLVDLGLPKMDGYETIRRLKMKPQFAHSVCIILSRRDGLVDKLKGRLAGAKMYITKPFTTQELLAAVNSALS